MNIGVDFGRVTTLRNLEHGLREALRYEKRGREGIREGDIDDELTEEPQTSSGGRRRRR